MFRLPGQFTPQKKSSVIFQKSITSPSCSFSSKTITSFSPLKQTSPKPFLRPSCFSSYLSTLSSSQAFPFSPSCLHRISYRNFQSYHSNEIGFQKKYAIDDCYIWVNRSYEDIYKHELVNKEVTPTWPGAVLVNDVKLTTSPQVPHYHCSPTNDLAPHLKTISPETFQDLKNAVTSQLCGTHLFVFDGIVGTNPRYRQKIRIISQTAWQYHWFKNLYLCISDLPAIPPDPEVLKRAYSMNSSENKWNYEYIDPTTYDPATFEPDIVVCYSTYSEYPYWLTQGFQGKDFVAINYEQKVIVATGLCRPYEVKLAIGSLMSYWLPQSGVLPTNSLAFISKKANVPYLFFGLPEYDKNLTNDYSITLVGDDYHGWADEGIFAYERGGYRIVSDVNPETEPIIVNAIRRNSIVENIRLTVENRLYWNAPGTQTNSWACFPMEFLQHGSRYGLAESPRVIVLGVYDSYGVLPLVSRLTIEQAIYFFLSGYIGRAENGVPVPEFFPCYSRGDLAFSPLRYAQLLEEKLRGPQNQQTNDKKENKDNHKNNHKNKEAKDENKEEGNENEEDEENEYDRFGFGENAADVYLVNVGWTGGSPNVGERIDPRLIRTAIRGLWSMLPDHPCKTLPFFGIQVPDYVDGIEEKYQQPEKYWIENRTYEERLSELATAFISFWDKSNLRSKDDKIQNRDWSEFGPKL